jgi:hypothetical protein
VLVEGASGCLPAFDSYIVVVMRLICLEIMAETTSCSVVTSTFFLKEFANTLLVPLKFSYCEMSLQSLNVLCMLFYHLGLSTEENQAAYATSAGEARELQTDGTLQGVSQTQAVSEDVKLCNLSRLYKFEGKDLVHGTEKHSSFKDRRSLCSKGFEEVVRLLKVGNFGIQVKQDIVGRSCETPQKMRTGVPGTTYNA